ncbi:MAG: DUF6678 family protein [Pseudomonadota bacterium]|jgi:hypothetical protein
MSKKVEHFHAAKHLGHDRRRRTIPRDYSASFMSDTKWRKFFEVVESQSDITRLLIRFVYDDREHEIGVLSLQCPHAWADFFQFGPKPLREIEWVEVPRHYFSKPSVRADQDVAALQLSLNQIGDFTLEETERGGLRVIGHRPSKPESGCA